MRQNNFITASAAVAEIQILFFIIIKEGNMAKQTSTLPQYQYKRKHGFFYNLKKYRVLTLMCVPAIVFFFAFNYMPLPGIYVAFVKYNYRDGIFGSKFVGMKNFEFLMQSGKLLGLTKNTILYNLAFIFLGNIIAMLMAVLLNEIHNKYFKKVSQTLMFLPYFISQVLVGFLVFNLLNSPCLAAISTMAQQMQSRKWFWFAVLYQNVFAYGVSLCVYQLGSVILGAPVGLGTAALILLFLLYMLFRRDPYKNMKKAVRRSVTA